MMQNATSAVGTQAHRADKVQRRVKELLEVVERRAKAVRQTGSLFKV
jgi:hypothetical protein